VKPSCDGLLLLGIQLKDKLLQRLRSLTGKMRKLSVLTRKVRDFVNGVTDCGISSIKELKGENNLFCT
jgi:hypothetical protein